MSKFERNNDKLLFHVAHKSYLNLATFHFIKKTNIEGKFSPWFNISFLILNQEENFPSKTLTKSFLYEFILRFFHSPNGTMNFSIKQSDNLNSQ